MSSDKAEHEAVRRHQAGVPPFRIDMARKGTNDRCVSCGRTPMAAGLRCEPCYFRVARPNVRGHGTQRGYDTHRKRNETPCSDCLEARSSYKRDQRRKQAA